MASGSLAAESLPDTETTSKMSNLGLNSSDDPPPKKRTKLTAEEKAEREKEKAEREREREEKRKEKEEKDKEKAKMRAEKEEQKRSKEEERIKKEAERAAEKVKREEEKARRDEEKAKREEEKNKKDRTQLRMDTFFLKKTPSAASTSGGPPTRPQNVTGGMAPPSAPKAVPVPSRSTDSAGPMISAVSATRDVEMLDRPDKTDYVKYFQPFFIRQGVTVAPPHSFGKDEEATSYICDKLDREVLKRRDEDAMDIDEAKFQIPHPLPPSHFQDAFALPPAKRHKRGSLPKLSTKEVLAGLNRSPGPVPQIFTSKGSASIDYVAQLKKLPRKVLKYWEDIRPAYVGTYTRIPKTSGLRKGRNPFQKSLPGVDYDYDSEAEWVEGPDDDGEDLLSEEEDDSMDVGSPDEMDDFLDDESEDAAKKRNNLSGPLIPATSGLMWEGECPNMEELEPYRIGVLTSKLYSHLLHCWMRVNTFRNLVGHDTPIDPFSAKYWQPGKKKTSNIFQPPSVPSNHAITIISRPGPPPSGGDTLAPPVNASGPQAGRHSVTVDLHPLSESVKDHHGRFWTDDIQDSIIRNTVLELEKNRGEKLTLAALASESVASQTNMSPRWQLQFFSTLYKLPINASSILREVCNFIERNDRSKIGLVEELRSR
ncbi:hypothetical protein ABW21_db0208211 [Orbilia brochopaga]|nr:hypothetical protein ABW21_db0208211 [Drechslerella brochopaga]